MPSLKKSKRPKYLPAKRRGNQDANKELYNSPKWRETSERIRKQDTIRNEGIGCNVCHYLYYELGLAQWNEPAHHCDHIISVSEGGAEFDERNLWGICRYHHNVKTGLEAHGLQVQVMPGRGGLVPVNREEVIRWVLKLPAPGGDEEGEGGLNP